MLVELIFWFGLGALLFVWGISELAMRPNPFKPEVWFDRNIAGPGLLFLGVLLMIASPCAYQAENGTGSRIEPITLLFEVTLVSMMMIIITRTHVSRMRARQS